MDKDTARRAHAILMQVLDAAPADRAAAIEHACRGNVQLRARVLELVSALDASTTFLETPALAKPRHTPSPPLGDVSTIGDYHIVRVVGVGGMATVYEAIQGHPRRRVALKVMHQNLAQTSAIHRFRYETEILARLQHPGIAQIFEAGTWEKDDGVAMPYFTMEYVSDARAITDFAAAHDLALSVRLSMFAEVCEAVQHGHQNGVIHRDLKPANILVDRSGSPKVIDFGVARSTDPQQAWITQHADVRHLIGTLNYMSPEQCHAAGSVDIRSDVFSLGVVLYELACGRLPHDFSGMSLPEALRIVREDDPPRPGVLDARLRGDIDAIVTKAMDKAPDRRYRSAAALGADIRRHLSNQTVEARPPTLLYQCRQFARRHRAVVTAAVLVALTVVAGAGVSARFAYQAWQESQHRRLAELSAVEQRDAAVWNAYVANVAAALSAYQTGELRQVRTRLARAPAALRGWEWHFLQGFSERSLHTMEAHDDMIFAFDATTDGRHLVTAGRDGVIRIWDSQTRDSLATLDATEGGPVYAVSLSPDERRLASGSDDGAIRIWDFSSRSLLRRIHAHQEYVRRVAYLNADIVASASVRGVGGLWHTESGEALAAGDTSTAHGVASSSDGTLLVLWTREGDIRLWDQDNHRLVHAFAFDGVVEYATLSPDRRLLAAGGGLGRVRVWETASGQLVHELRSLGGANTVSMIAFSPSGDLLAVGQFDRRITLVSMENGQLTDTLPGHEEAVSGLAFSADGRTLFSSSWDRTVRVWGLDPGMRTDYVTVLTGHTDYVHAAAFSPDSTLLATGGRDHVVRLWEPRLGTPLGTLDGHADTVSSVAFSPDGRLIASGSYDRSIRLWSVATGELEAALVGHDGNIWTVAFSPDGRWLASAGNDATIQLWGVETRQAIRSFKGHQARVNKIAFSPNGQTLASASRDHTACLWDVASGQMRWRYTGHHSDVFDVVFNNEGHVVYSGSRDQTVGILDAATGRNLDRLVGHGQFVTSLALSPDGGRLAAGSWFGEVVLWDTRQQDIVASYKAHANPIRSVAFSPNGRWLASGSHDGTVRLHDAAPAEQRLAGHHAAEKNRARAEAQLHQLSGRSDSPAQLLDQLDTEPDLDPEVRFWVRLLILKRALDPDSLAPSDPPPHDGSTG